MTANLTTPVGRLLMGSLYVAQTTDAEGKPLVNKSGPNVGQPKVQFFFAIGIPKAGEQHWSQTPWGQIVLNEGRTAFPQAHAAPGFAWKVKDGDSQVPNRVGKRPCDQLGHPGHWILSFTSGYAPKVYNRDGTAPIIEKDAVKLGYYIQVNANVNGNGSVQQPGVYLNHSMVALSAYGEEIVVGPDPTSAGFGGGALPVGALAAPVQAAFNPAIPGAQAVGGGALPGQQAAAQYNPNIAGAGAPPMPGPGQTLPYPQGTAAPLYNQGLGMQQGVPPPPPPPNPAILQMPTVPQMTAKAQGASYQQLIAAGWNDGMLRAEGLMI
jgi:hypothetical protein